MAAEALHKHFQQHRRYRPRDENFDVTGDFAKTKPFHAKKSNIYVHEFFNVGQNHANWESYQNQLHRNLYNHETDHAHPLKYERIKSKSFQDSYISNRYSSSSRHDETPSHTFSNSKTQAVLKNRNAITKLEESYWANWKPNKSETVKPRKTSKAHYRVIRKPPPQKTSSSSSSSSISDEEGEVDDEQNESSEEKEEEILEQKGELIKEPEVRVETKKSEEIQVPTDLSQIDLVQMEEEEKVALAVQHEETDEIKPLKHTDSFILTAKRQNEEKPHYQQPRCIKLFKKPIVAASGAAIVRGGSYPLKPSLKKEKTVIKGNIRLGRPGSPIMIQANRRRKGI